ncbi:MAG: hypothetical protein N3C62_02320 [Synergistetes bacterium]|nr:hypothetical protein [Synergistota bacterium]
MIEIIKGEIDRKFGGILWEKVESTHEDYSCNLPEVVVFMGLKGGKELIIAFSKGLLKRLVAMGLNCDEALVSEIEIVNKAKSLSLEITKPIFEDLVPYPAILKGNFMELMVHKAVLHAYYGSFDREHIFLGVVEPIEGSTNL